MLDVFLRHSIQHFLLRLLKLVLLQEGYGLNRGRGGGGVGTGQRGLSDLLYRSS